jgi:hypothetical protein
MPEPGDEDTPGGAIFRADLPAHDHDQMVLRRRLPWRRRRRKRGRFRGFSLSHPCRVTFIASGLKDAGCPSLDDRRESPSGQLILENRQEAERAGDGDAEGVRSTFRSVTSCRPMA